MNARIGFCVLATLGLTLGACARDVATGPYLAPGIGTGDVDFITKSYNVQHFDFDEGHLAQTHSTNKQVQAMAAYLIARGGALRDQIKPVGERLGIAPPDRLNPALQAKLDHAATLQGPAFDRAYVEDQIDSHEYYLRHAQDVSTDTENPDLARMLPPSIAQLKASLARLHALEATLPPG